MRRHGLAHDLCQSLNVGRILTWLSPLCRTTGQQASKCRIEWWCPSSEQRQIANDVFFSFLCLRMFYSMVFASHDCVCLFCMCVVCWQGHSAPTVDIWTFSAYGSAVLEHQTFCCLWAFYNVNKIIEFQGDTCKRANVYIIYAWLNTENAPTHVAGAQAVILKKHMTLSAFSLKYIIFIIVLSVLEHDFNNTTRK